MARRGALLRLHQALTARCVALRKSLADEVETLHRFRTEQTGDSAAAAFDCDGEEVSVRLAELEARELTQIERALTRLEQGTYGVCEVCQGKIPVARLNALPYSTTCVECQRKIEGSPEREGRRREGWERVCDAGPATEEQIDLAKLQFVGLVSFLAIFFRDQYALTTVRAGAVATLCALTGSLIRPLGGYLSDRFGGLRVLGWLYLGVAATMAGVSAPPALGPCTLLLVTGMTLLGMGNGAVFQLVARRFPKEIGVITGLVGAAGGLGGFVLPNALGSLRQLTQSYGGGFLAFALVGVSGAVALFFVGRTWEGTFLGKGGAVVVRPVVPDVRKNRLTDRNPRQETGERPPYHSS